MSFVVGTVLLALVTALSCALPGVFVVLRKSSMLVDAIGHSVLLGIVLGYFLTKDLNSPVLIVGAALSGLVVVAGANYLQGTGLLTGDAPQGLIFPALFSIAVILITVNFSNIHLDVHAVLVGDLNLMAFTSVSVGGVDIGPPYLYVMVAVLLCNTLAIGLLYNNLRITTFDPAYARSLGINVVAIDLFFTFIMCVSVTAAFNAAGSILVVALLVIPAACAQLLTGRLGPMIAWTLLIAGGGAVAGFLLAYWLDAATSAGMAVFYGLIFFVCLAYSRLARRRRVASHLSVTPVGL